MSSKKDKLIESATKYIVKGQIDRAIKEYEQIVALEPGDIRNRQKLAELLVRDNRKAEALAEFESIGKYYTNNAFYLKAIAVYKQVQKLDPSSVATSLTLADLNIKQGLIGNAIAEWNTALSLYEHDGKTDEMQNVLQLMRDADPESLPIRLKMSELLVKMGKEEEAYKSYTDLACTMLRKGNEIGLQQLRLKMPQLFPAFTDFILDLAESLISSQDYTQATRILREELDKDRTKQRAWQLLAASLSASGQRDQLLDACRDMIQFLPDDPAPRETIITITIENGDFDEALEILEATRRRLIASGREPFLIEAYNRIMEILPGDQRPLSALKSLYRETGKSAELEPLSRKNENSNVTLDAAFEPTAEEFASSSPPHLSDELSLTVSPHDDNLSKYEWEEAEEIDLAELEGFVSNEDADLSPLENDTSVAVSHDGDSSPEDFSVDWDVEVPDIGDIELIPGFSETVQETRTPSPPQKRKQQVRLGEALEESDIESHYDLGIAYKEMGLFDEAIGQFEMVAKVPSRRVDCLTLQGLCLREKGDSAAAEEAFVRALQMNASPNELLCSRYELAELLATRGKIKEALRLYEEVSLVDPEYRETVSKMSELQAASDPSTAYLSDQLLELIKDHEE